MKDNWVRREVAEIVPYKKTEVSVVEVRVVSPAVTSLFVLVALSTACGPPPTPPAVASKVQPKTPAPAEGASAPTHEGLVGVIVPWREIRLVAPMEGVIADNQRAAGTEVRAGDAVATIERPPGADASHQMLLSAIRLADIDSAETLIEASRAEARFHTAETLLLQGLVSRQAVVDARFDVQIASQRRSAAQERALYSRAALDKQREELLPRTMRAPFSGVVSALEARAGEFVARGQPILRFVQPLPYRLRLALPSASVGQIGKGWIVRGTVSGTGEPLCAIVDATGSEVDPATQTRIVEAQVMLLKQRSSREELLASLGAAVRVSAVAAPMNGGGCGE